MMWGNEDSLSAIQTASQGHLTSVHMTGGTLTVDSALADGQSIDIHGNSTLSIAEGSVLNRSDVQVSSGTVTLDGAGEYVLGSPNLSETLAAGWTGIISVSDRKDAINLNSYANTNSKVKLNGLAGWMDMNALTTSKELIMGEGADGAPAFKITAMSDNKNITFTNKISGHGVFEVCDANNASGDTVEFSGDISKWDGTLKYNVSGSNAKTLKFSGNATEVNVGIENAAGTANVEIANGNAVTVNSTISGEGTTNLKASGNGTKEFTKALAVNNVDIAGGTVTFDQAATANGTFSASTVTAKGALTLNGTSTADTITVEGGSVAVNSSLTLNGVNTIAYDKVTVGAGATITTGAAGSLTSDGIVYAKGATITGGDTAKNLSAWTGGYSVSGGEVTINAGNGNSDDRDISMVVNGSALTSNVKGTLTLKKNAVLGDGSVLNGVSVLEGDGTFVGTTTIMENVTVNGTATLGAEVDGSTVAGQLVLTNDAVLTANNEVVSQLASGTDATITGAGVVSVATSGLTYTNAAIEIATSEEVTTAAKLNNSKLTVLGTTVTDPSTGEETTSTGTVSVTVEQGSTNDFDATAGNVKVSTGDLTGEANKTTVGTLEVGAGKTVTIQNSTGDNTATTVTESATVAGTVTTDVIVAAAAEATQPSTFEVTSATAKVDGNMTVESTGALKLTAAGSKLEIAKSLEITGAGTIAINAAESLTVKENLTLSATTIIDLTGMVVNANEQLTLITVDGSISASAVKVKGLTTDLEWTLKTNTGTLLASSNGTAPASLSGNMPLSLSGVGDSIILSMGGDTPDTLTATTVTGVALSGSVLTLTLADEAASATFGKNLNLTFANNTLWGEFMEGQDNPGMNVTLAFEANGSALALGGTTVTFYNSYSGDGAGNYRLEYIPEPTTGTLSVLALAALALRRRRK